MVACGYFYSSSYSQYAALSDLITSLQLSVRNVPVISLRTNLVRYISTVHNIRLYQFGTLSLCSELCLNLWDFNKDNSNINKMLQTRRKVTYAQPDKRYSGFIYRLICFRKRRFSYFCSLFLILFRKAYYGMIKHNDSLHLKSMCSLQPVLTQRCRLWPQLSP